MKLTCKECGGPVVFVNEKATRACGHNEAGLLAEVTAHAYGVSHFEQNFIFRKAKELWDKIVDSFRK